MHHHFVDLAVHQALSVESVKLNSDQLSESFSEAPDLLHLGGLIELSSVDSQAVSRSEVQAWIVIVAPENQKLN